MTESKAIEVLDYSRTYYENMNFGAPRIALDMAIKALEEVQQYREIIGLTPEKLKLLEKDEIQTIEDALKAFAEWSQYRAIGTVSEFRELKEKATAKKPIPYENTGIIECPHCYTNISDSKTKWCCICGQHLDWSEGKE